MGQRAKGKEEREKKKEKRRKRKEKHITLLMFLIRKPGSQEKRTHLGL